MPSEYIVSSAAAVAFHLSTLNLELDFVWFPLAGFYIVTFWTLVVFRAYEEDAYGERQGIIAATVNTALLAAIFNTSLTFSIITHRLLFHRIRSFPGPFGAKISKLWTMFQIKDNLQGHLLYKSLHDRYGDWVRIGPREIITVAPGAVQKIYGASSPCARSLFSVARHPTPDAASVIGLVDRRIHRKRRRAWNRAFTRNSLVIYEPKVDRLSALFISRLRSKAGAAVDASRWAKLFATDVMGSVGLGKTDEMLEKGEVHPAIRVIEESARLVTFLLHVPWLTRVLVNYLGGGSATKNFYKWCHDEIDAKVKNFNPDEKPTDIAGILLRDEDSDFHKGTRGPMYSEARLLIVAGSDTTASAIAGMIFYLAGDPTVYGKLQQMLDNIFPGGDDGFSHEKIASLDYLNAIIDETLRLQPSVAGTVLRQTPPEGMTIDGVYIPGNINVSVPTHAVHRHPQYWVKPDEFIPERWTDEKPELIKDKQAFMPFLHGFGVCAGKQLAYMEMRMVIARMALNFDLEYGDRETPMNFERDRQDLYTLNVPRLMIKFKPRKTPDL